MNPSRKLESPALQSDPCKRESLFCRCGERQGSQGPNLKRWHTAKKRRHFFILLPFPYGAKKALALLEQQVKDDFSFPEVQFLFATKDQKDSKRYPYRQKTKHLLKQCFTLRKIFYEEHRAWEILFQEGTTSINNLHPKSMMVEISTHDDGPLW